MIVYSVTISVENDIHDQWLDWMLGTHLPQVMATGCFASYRMLLMLDEEAGQGTTYNLQYTAPDMVTYQRYAAEFAPALQAETKKLFDGKYVAFRTLLEVMAQGEQDL